MDAAHHSLLFHTNVRWLSKGNVTERAFELREEFKLFLKFKVRWNFLPDFWMRKSCVFDIQLIYIPRPQMQGRKTNVIKFLDTLKAIKSKL